MLISVSSNRDSKSTILEQVTDQNKSSLHRYQDLAIGTNNLWDLTLYEAINFFFSGMPGAPGLLLRKILYPKILSRVGRNVLFGRNVAIRHGRKIELGDNVIIDDNVLLDAKGSSNSGLSIGNNSMISRNCTLACKGGNIKLGSNGVIGVNSLIHAVKGSDVIIGNDVIIGAFTYFIGGGGYNSSAPDIPFKKQGAVTKGGVVVKDNVWIGSHVQLLDGVHVGTGCIIGAGAVVTKDIEDYAVVAGIPARKIRSRKP